MSIRYFEIFRYISRFKNVDSEEMSYELLNGSI